ncbi:MAG: DUF1631 domain-containing protein [Pseudomonadota bacterium]|nr:DUF1631 domain-containing protein [Pseudomonadota bacterium]
MQHPDMGGQVASDPLRLIDELKRIAVEQLGAVPGGLYRPIEEQLHEGLRNGNESAQRKDLMAVLALRQRGSGFVMKFRELIGRSFDDYCGRATVGRTEAPLGLVLEDDLDFHLAGQALAESIASRYQRPLEMLGARFESLASALGVPGGANPVGSLLLANAFVQTFHEAEVSPSLRELLFRQYEHELAKVLGELYGRLNTQLAANGFHADPRVTATSPVAAAVQQQAFQPTPASPLDAASKIMNSRQAGAWLEAGIGGMAPEAPLQQRPVAPALKTPAALQSTPAAEPQAAPNADMFRASPAVRVQHQQLRDMLHAWREGTLSAGHGARVPDEHAPDRRLGDRRELRPQEVRSVASLLQGEGVRHFEAALAGKGSLHEAIREEMLEGARRLGLDPDRTCLDPQHEDAIDLTGLLFESMLKGTAMVQRARRLFARLVMSYVKVALSDDNLFLRQDHPARRLLDGLAITCEGNEGASAHEREMLDHASELVERVVSEYNEDLAIFELAADELSSLLDQQRRRADLAERRAAETVHGRERLLHARAQAAAALSERIAGRTLTPTIAHFLDRHWQHHLVQVLLRDGADSERYPRVLALADELVALDEAAGRCEGGTVATRVLALHNGLVEALSSSGLDEQVASEWLAGLARTLAFPDSPREQRSEVALPDQGEDEAASAVLRLAGGTDGLEFDPAVAERMRSLHPGDWMRLTDEQGNETPVKVAWASPLTGRLLLVNRRGVRQLVASPEQLASLVRSGHLFAEADERPFDEAMRLVRQRLGRSAARAA